MNKILVTGSYGQLGKEIAEITGKLSGSRFLFSDIDTLDITSNSDVKNYFRKNRPGFVINCAAYTAVDKAETDIEDNFKSHLFSGTIHLLYAIHGI